MPPVRTILRMVFWTPAAFVLLVVCAAVAEKLATDSGVIDRLAGWAVIVLSALGDVAGSPWFAWIGGISLGLAGGYQLDAFLRRRELEAPSADQSAGEEDDPDWEGKLQSVMGRHFVNERVVLDGHLFVGCEFQNIRLVYNGGPFSLRNNTFRGFVLESENENLQRLLSLMVQFNLTSAGIVSDRGQTTPEAMQAQHGNVHK